ncbi:tape measure protein [Acinetobacter sp. ANC 5045]|uniref:tape measure protein n=1 Tax=Acinetobacter sp. ANC 5045 TaxID=2529851 RepID=UPI00103C7C15|nr:tape measure protein [Acinetobacter sp. ANC 5045]TCB17318.1 tape measure domain-containing protein [Acinetobacter sp. ANC 5045]
MSKNLTFKLIMDADSKGFVSGVKQSESVAKSVFEAIKAESDKLKQSSAEAAKELGNIIPKGTSELAAGLTKSLFSATEIIKGAGDNAKSTAGNFTDFGNKSHKALELLKSDLISAKQKLQEFANSNASPADIEVAQRQVDQLEKEVQQADQAFNDFQAEVGRANTQLKETDSAAASAKKGLDGAKFAVNALMGAMAALGVGLGLREIAEAADSYTNLSTRIQIATKEGGNFESAMAGVHQVALATNSSLQATGDLFTRIDSVGKEMGMTQQQALDLTKTVTQAIQIGGGSAQASEAAITQFIQAMQGGVLRGEEFNSIMENGYGLAEALAKGLGVTTGELRKMAENGELTSERVAKALQSQAAQIQSTYDQFPTTIGNALTKIATQWQILIGTMDQAHGASSVVAEALSTIADNLGILKVFFDDVAEGVGWFRDKLAEIDPATIDAVRSALSDAYDVVKNLIKSMAGIAETAWSAFTSTLDAISPLFNAMLSGQQNVSGLTTLFNVFRVALGVVSDAATGLNIGLKLLLSGLQFLAGGLTALQAKVLDFIGFDTLAKQAQDASDRLFAQAEKNAKEANRLALESKSATIAALEDIRKTDEEKNQERIANSQKTLDELKTQEEKHRADYKAISDERIKLEQQLHEARKSGNQAAIDIAVKGLAELDAKEKAYQAESKKITDAKIEAAQAYIDSMITMDEQTSKVISKEKEAYLAAQGLKLEFDSTGKAIVKAMGDGAIATDAQSNATDKARKAAAALGLDLDVSLNRVSEKFGENANQIDAFIAGLEGLGAKGKQAGEVTYQAWLKWLETAKSQAEIDMAKAKLEQFGEQGKLSTSQVEQGLIAVKNQAQGLPDDIDPVTAAFKRLGIETKENLKLSAQQALMDYITIRDSGQATAEGIQKAYEKAAQAAALSGDQAVIASANAAGAGRDLRVEIDETGKASVKAMDDLTEANHRVRESARRIGDGYREAGQIAREEANAAQVAWNKASQEAAQKWDAEMKRQSKGLSAAISGYQSMSKNDVISQIKSMGYSEDQAKKLAGSIWSQAMATDRDAKFAAYGKGGNLAMNKLIEQEFNNAAAKGLTTQHGTNKINELLRNLDIRSTGSTKVNDYAPSISEPKVRDLQNDTSTKNVRFEFVSGGKRFEMLGSQEDGDTMESILREFEMLKKAM